LAAFCTMLVFRDCADLLRSGVRFFYDPCRGSHAPRMREFVSIEVLHEGPPLSTLQPIVGLVAHDTLYLVHRALVAHGGLVAAKLRNDDIAGTLLMWGQEIPVLSVAPPHPFEMPPYITGFVLGCRCRPCRRAMHSRITGGVIDYMFPSAGAQT